MKKNLHIFFLAAFPAIAAAQDIHFSQYEASPLNLNPAQAGNFSGDYRFTANHRSQWGSVTIPFRTFSGAYDMSFRKKSNGWFGAGILLNSDRAGDSRMGILQGNIVLSYTSKLNRDSTLFLSFGMSAGMAQRSVDYSRLTFDEQFDGQAYNPALNNWQNLGNISFTFFDCAAGMNWHYRSPGRFRINAGTAFSHLNTPSQAFLAASASRLPLKTAIYAIPEIKITSEFDLIPSMLYQRQSSFSELCGGVTGRYILRSQSGYTSALYLGVSLRKSDALVFLAAMDYRDFRAGFSYDVNTSGLRPASNGWGGFEFSCAYIIRKFIPLKVIRKVCPVYL